MDLLVFADGSGLEAYRTFDETASGLQHLIDSKDFAGERGLNVGPKIFLRHLLLLINVSREVVGVAVSAVVAVVSVVVIVQ